MFRMRSVLSSLGALFSVVVALTPPTAYACQLVCIIAAGALTDAGCSAVKSGFKVARPGMLAALPSITPEYYGTPSHFTGGLSCDDLVDTAGINTGYVSSDGLPHGPQSTYVAAYNNCNSRYGALNPHTVCCNM